MNIVKSNIKVAGNLTEIPAGLSYSEMKNRYSNNYWRVPWKEMSKTSRIPNKMSQRMFAEYIRETLRDGPYLMKIFQGNQQKWSKRGSVEELRHWSYTMAMRVGATINRRNGKTNKDYTFEMEKI